MLFWASLNLSSGHVRSHKKFGPNRFSRFDVYWIQTNRQPNKQTNKPNLYIDGLQLFNWDRGNFWVYPLKKEFCDICVREKNYIFIIFFSEVKPELYSVNPLQKLCDIVRNKIIKFMIIKRNCSCLWFGTFQSVHNGTLQIFFKLSMSLLSCKKN